MVVTDYVEHKVSCTCKLFEKIGILYSHALKVLDCMNIKQIPEHYILKRWTLEARSGTIEDVHGRKILEDPKLDATCRYKIFSHKCLGLAFRVSNSEDCFLLADSLLDSLCRQVEEKMRLSLQPTIAAQTTTETYQNLTHVTGLKKKETKTTSSKRKKSWVEKFHNKSNKVPYQAKSHKKTNMKGAEVSNAAQHEPLVEKGIEGFEFLGTYTQLLMGQPAEHDFNFEGSSTADINDS